MKHDQRDSLLRSRSAMGPYLTLTLVLFASLAPNLALASATGGLSGIDTPLAIRRAVASAEPVVLGGLVLTPAACAVISCPVVLPDNAPVADARPPADTPPGPREAAALPPVRGP